MVLIMHFLHPYRWRILAILSTCLLMVSMDATILHTALPTIVKDMKPSGIQQLWIINAYALVLAGLLITMGALGDRTGRKRLLIGGLILFSIASLLSVMIDHPWTLVFCRALLGLGGAMLMPSTLSILRHVFIDKREQTVAIAMWGVMASVGVAIGPVVGGILVEFFGWESAFLVNIPIALITMVTAMMWVPESSDPSDQSWDWWGVLQSCLGMTLLVQGIKASSKGALLAWESGGLFALGILLLIIFVQRQRKQPDPLADVSLFSIRAFSISILTYFAATCAMSAMLYLMSQWLQFVQGFNALEAGLWILPMTVSGVFAAIIVPLLLNRLSARILLAGSLFLIAGALLSLSILPDEAAFLLILSLVVLGLGVSAALAITVVLMMTCVPIDRTGGAAALQETGYEVGNVLGIAIVGSLTMSLYRAALVIPEGVPASLAQLARDSIGEGAAILPQLPEALRETLAQAMSSAFSYAFNFSAVLLGVSVLVVAIAAFCCMPPPPSPSSRR